MLRQLSFLVISTLLASAVASCVVILAFAAKESYWEGLAGGLIGAAVTASAVWFTNRQTVSLYERGLREQKREQSQRRLSEVRRTLSIIHHAMGEDIKEYALVEAALEMLCTDATRTNWNDLYQRIWKSWTRPSSPRIAATIDHLGDVDTDVVSAILVYDSTSTKVRIITQFDHMRLPEFDPTGASISNDREFLRSQKRFAAVIQVVIDRYLAINGLEPLVKFSGIRLSTAEKQFVEDAEKYQHVDEFESPGGDS